MWVSDSSLPHNLSPARIRPFRLCSPTVLCLFCPVTPGGWIMVCVSSLTLGGRGYDFNLCLHLPGLTQCSRHRDIELEDAGCRGWHSKTFMLPHACQIASQLCLLHPPSPFTLDCSVFLDVTLKLETFANPVFCPWISLRFLPCHCARKRLRAGDPQPGCTSGFLPLSRCIALASCSASLHLSFLICKMRQA